MKNLRLTSLIAGIFAVTFGPAVIAANVQDTQAEQPQEQSAMDKAGDYIDDAAITTKVKSTILGSDALNVLEINVETQDGVVQLSGFVKEAEDVDTAERLARNVEGVKDVENDIQVKSDAS
ncbi:hypothetical protein IDAT_02280 [Pseudidiomarina atlantica]|uniref:Osmotically-inducible protein Y n=1 Tax=Pseudidiomarina atlantica TaxID=1517416 RepID=A0A094IVT8_9GAMM|nr:BON domain-containing protein [Pseudidiomarina atlantica]KFZ29934.1 hypothetical protein IDAT_02280 [Pseudidiomarina atlantica]